MANMEQTNLERQISIFKQLPSLIVDCISYKLLCLNNMKMRLVVEFADCYSIFDWEFFEFIEIGSANQPKQFFTKDFTYQEKVDNSLSFNLEFTKYVSK